MHPIEARIVKLEQRAETQAESGRLSMVDILQASRARTALEGPGPWLPIPEDCTGILWDRLRQARERVDRSIPVGGDL